MMSRITCPKCRYGGIKIKRNGLTSTGKQRWQCGSCQQTWSKPRKQYKKYGAKSLFEKWLLGSSIHELTRIAKLSKTHIQRLLTEQLARETTWDKAAIASCEYAALDGKFLFGRKYTVLILFNTKTNKPVASKVVKGETKQEITAFLRELKAAGLNPIAITTDGKGTVSRCCREIFPSILTQRCLFHIVLQINAWVRIPPRTSLGWQLHNLVSELMLVETPEQAERFWTNYERLKTENATEIVRMKRNPAARIDYDTAKCFSLLDHARPDMFLFIGDRNIAKTTSGLEGFNKQIQNIRGFSHNGLTKEHLDKFIVRYIQLKSKNSRTKVEESKQ